MRDGGSSAAKSAMDPLPSLARKRRRSLQQELLLLALRRKPTLDDENDNAFTSLLDFPSDRVYTQFLSDFVRVRCFGVCD